MGLSVATRAPVESRGLGVRLSRTHSHNTTMLAEYGALRMGVRATSSRRVRSRRCSAIHTKITPQDSSEE